MLFSIIAIENEVAKISFNGLINEFAEKWSLKLCCNQDIFILIYEGHCYFIIQNHGTKLLFSTICNITCWNT